MFNQGGIRSIWHFPEKKHPYKMVVVNAHVHFDCAGWHKTVAPGLAFYIFFEKTDAQFYKITLVKCPCAFRLCRLSQNVCFGISMWHSHFTFSSKMTLVTSPGVTLGLSDRSRCGVVLTLRWPAQPFHHFGPVTLLLGPVTSLSLRCGAYLDRKGDLVQRS